MGVKMNWIKGFDRVFLVFAIPVFILVTGYILLDIEQRPYSYPFLREPNPAYETWKQEYGKKWEESQSWTAEDYLDAERIPPDPPNRYLPIKTYKKILCAVGVGLGASIVWLGVLCGTTRLIRIAGKFIVTGFKI